MKRIVLGILSHVDSGKTTLSEALLYRSGTIKKLGRVDNGNAYLDSYSLERDRGITIFSKQAILNIGDTYITLIDTPGHVDFSAEMERTLQVLDYAILVISGTDGVQSHTETLWALLKRYRVPTFIFVNKMDMVGSDKQFILRNLRGKLSESCVDFSKHIDHNDFCEALSLCDERVLEKYVDDGDIDDTELAGAISRRNVFPVFFGSALRLDGIDEFIARFVSLTAQKNYSTRFAAKVFKISDDNQGNRLTYMKITGGTLSVREPIFGREATGKPWEEKVNRIRLYSGVKFDAIDRAEPGMICAVTGLTKTYAGEGLGSETSTDLPTLEPVLNYRVELPNETDVNSALKMFRRLEEEDPALHVTWNESLQEIHIQLMGEVQLEVIKSIIQDRFKLDIDFGPGSIVYKETIKSPVTGIGHFEPLRHYSEVHLLLEPALRGSGLSFATSCREDDLDRNWQRLILTHLEEKTHIGVLTGSPITDMKITLTAGRGHIKHTEGGDFRQATYRAVRQGLRRAESVLLEPYYSFIIHVPSENIGRVMADIQRMKGSFSPPEIIGDTSKIAGSVPVSEMLDYHKELRSFTKGKGRMACTLKGYEPCHNSDEIIAKIAYSCDADLENTADSVFCSHGAGFVVPWYETEKYMHIEAGQKTIAADPDTFEIDSSPSPTPVPVRVREYADTLSADKELLAIFERTYGPIKRDPRIDFRPVTASNIKKQVPYRQKEAIVGPEYLLVDGYNIIFAWDELSELARENLEAARMKLIDILCNFQGYKKCKLIVVFDAYKVKGNPGEVERWHNVDVVYTKEAETADMYIERVTHELGRKYRVRVATSDGLEQLIILGHGALRLSAQAFRQEVEEAEKEIRSYLQN